MENNENTSTEETTEETNVEENTATGAENTENKESADNTDWKAEALKYKAIANRRDKQAQNTTKETETNNEVSESILDEVYLAAGGVSKDEVAQLKIIAKGKGISLAEAQKDPMFEALKKGRDVDISHKKSQLGASYSGGTTESGESPSADREKRYQDIKQKLEK